MFDRISNFRTAIGGAGVLLAIVCGGTLPQGCDPCEATVIVIDQGEALLPDAQAKLNQAAALIRAMPAGAVKNDALAAIEEATKGLQLAQEVLRHARTTCSALNVQKTFHAFAKAWDRLKPFISNFGGAGPYVSDPEAYEVGISQ